MRRAWMPALDAAVFVAFAAVGRSEHGGTLDVGTVALIAAPFLIGWFAAALATGLYVGRLSLRRAALTFLLGLPLGFTLRVLAFGRGLSGQFIPIAVAFCAIFLFGWRLAALAVARGRARRGTSA